MKELSRHPDCRGGRHRRIGQSGEQGQALVEFALIVPMLFLILVGVAFISQGINLQMVLYGAAYEGARVWAKNPVIGDDNHCNLPACDPTRDNAINFEKYIIPAVKNYLTKNGFDGNTVRFFSIDETKFRDNLQFVNNQRQLVRVDLFYPVTLPVGTFAQNFQLVWVYASCTMKRGS